MLIEITMLEIHSLPVLQDNYIHLLHDSVSKQTAVIDPALAEPVVQFLEKRQWQLTMILNTHHHYDHVGGNSELKRQTGCHVVASLVDQTRIPNVNQAVTDGDCVFLGDHCVHVMLTPGHTLGHCVYYVPTASALFCGDTVFAMGCGRLLEGSAEQLWASLQKIMALPKTTLLYCAHEYTQANARFALQREPGNQVLQDRALQVAELRQQGLPTIPTLLKDELATNPFFRVDSPEIRANLQLTQADQLTVFTALRLCKDNF